ncbi:helix-hairpin-helix domain-containing protein, partial [Candidatus Desantisbacteria bacterium]|nr:helix-hairpin-helix domain-containing protein [Candidatus Desantisbacteria bacterium]
KKQVQWFPVNINIASASELETLPGIGPAKAKAIQDYRNIHGPFQRIEDITMVKGIGEKIFERIKLLITTGETPMSLQDTQVNEDSQL